MWAALLFDTIDRTIFRTILPVHIISPLFPKMLFMYFISIFDEGSISFCIDGYRACIIFSLHGFLLSLLFQLQRSLQPITQIK